MATTVNHPRSIGISCHSRQQRRSGTLSSNHQVRVGHITPLQHHHTLTQTGACLHRQSNIHHFKGWTKPSHTKNLCRLATQHLNKYPSVVIYTTKGKNQKACTNYSNNLRRATENRKTGFRERYKVGMKINNLKLRLTVNSQ